MTEVRDLVRDRYAAIARQVRTGEGCGCGEEGCGCSDADCRCAELGPSCCGSGSAVFGPELYDDDVRSRLPSSALLSSLGCGVPTRVADLREGEVVLDIGSGGGIDVLMSAARVGATGTVYGLDMTPEMVEIAREGAVAAGATNVEFLLGVIEDIPLPADTIDVIISNCVINLSPDKSSVFGEMFRVLRPGGRVGLTDVVAADELTPEERAARGTLTGCIAGALSFGEYRSGLQATGFLDVDVVPTHEVADRMYGAIVRARKPPSSPRPL